MIFVTGDTHGHFQRIISFCEEHETTGTKDVMIILGDAGINYYGGEKSKTLKEMLSTLPIIFFCIHGNHENRPRNIRTYEKAKFCEGTVYYERAYPNILFAKDGEVFRFAGLDVMTVGGAYSVDKYYRLLNGLSWWHDEQPSEKIKQKVETTLKARGQKIDVMLTHTCPFKYFPMDSPKGKELEYSEFDISTEQWLDQLENQLSYKSWLCGHFHINKTTTPSMQFIFDEIHNFNDIGNRDNQLDLVIM